MIILRPDPAPSLSRLGEVERLEQQVLYLHRLVSLNAGKSESFIVMEYFSIKNLLNMPGNNSYLMF